MKIIFFFPFLCFSFDAQTKVDKLIRHGFGSGRLSVVHDAMQSKVTPTIREEWLIYFKKNHENNNENKEIEVLKYIFSQCRLTCLLTEHNKRFGRYLS